MYILLFVIIYLRHSLLIENHKNLRFEPSHLLPFPFLVVFLNKDTTTVFSRHLHHHHLLLIDHLHVAFRSSSYCYCN
ncbi:hypothetical protein L1987_43612 [Smallanthus sonchifolius]|uniref:Uncharacterized protein n=1 Tax=Smallanthus sonchifolius TaxID=185202 RepID=A0ACB9GMW3_9ASTR|nr:hypothetical protein L1987_43612 [Smallanthus sonchifolius]